MFSPRRDSTYNWREVRPLSILKRRLKLCNKRSSDSVRKNDEQYVFAVSVREAMSKFEHQVYSAHSTYKYKSKKSPYLLVFDWLVNAFHHSIQQMRAQRGVSEACKGR